MTTLMITLEQSLEAEDGVVEVQRVRPHLDVPWVVVEPGPRRWAPTDLSVEIAEDGSRLELVRMTYRTVGERSIVVAGLRPEGDVDHTAQRLTTPLLFAHLRRVHPKATVAAIMAAIDSTPTWGEPAADGWRSGVAGSGDRPVRLAHVTRSDGHVLVASHGVAEEELATILASAVEVTRDDAHLLDDLHVRHRRALAQRWWDAPRTPWVPED